MGWIVSHMRFFRRSVLIFSVVVVGFSLSAAIGVCSCLIFGELVFVLLCVLLRLFAFLTNCYGCFRFTKIVCFALVFFSVFWFLLLCVSV